MKIILTIAVLVTVLFAGKYSPTVEQRVDALRTNIIKHNIENDENVKKMLVCLDKVETKDDYSFCKYQWKQGDYSITKVEYIRLRDSKIPLLEIRPD